jgi:photosynthetic reaction center cytochrome c subunit
MKTAIQMALGAVALLAGFYLAGSTFTFFRHVLVNSGHPPILVEQLGRRGTATQQLTNPRVTEALMAANVPPPAVPRPGVEGEKAGEVYENVRVLGDVSTGEFTRLMVAMTEWVAPDQGCAACHDVADFAADTLYTKVAARRMLEMTRHINANWTEHVADTGVTCFTCHRGRLVPPNIWFNNPGQVQASSFLPGTAGPKVAVAPRNPSSVVRDPMSLYLEGDADLRVTSTVSRNSENRLSIKQARGAHGLMIHMSQALGVNCAYCHHSRAFNSWEQSRQQRVTAWHGIRMVRELNNDYLNPLKATLPAHRLGPALGDAPKVNCATCHNGVFKPLFGRSMLPDFPELKGAPAPDDGPPTPMAQAASSTAAER